MRDLGHIFRIYFVSNLNEERAIARASQFIVWFRKWSEDEMTNAPNEGLRFTLEPNRLLVH